MELVLILIGVIVLVAWYRDLPSDNFDPDEIKKRIPYNPVKKVSQKKTKARKISDDKEDLFSEVFDLEKVILYEKKLDKQKQAHKRLSEIYNLTQDLTLKYKIESIDNHSNEIPEKITGEGFSKIKSLNYLRSKKQSNIHTQSILRPRLSFKLIKPKSKKIGLDQLSNDNLEDSKFIKFEEIKADGSKVTGYKLKNELEINSNGDEKKNNLRDRRLKKLRKLR